jgi:inositol-hexakisphosphate/diphosphoinositol-pentakisphosphate 1-kinase
VASDLFVRFELYEREDRVAGANKSDKEFAIRLSLSEGAHSSNVLDSAIDARHALNVQARKSAVMPLSFSPPEFVPDPAICRRLTQHLDYGLVIEKLSKHFDRVPEVREVRLPISEVTESRLSLPGI